MRIAASVVAQKNPTVLTPSRPTRLTLPSPATPANSAVTTSGITTIESRLRNSVPSGRSPVATVISVGCCVVAAANPSTRPAARPIVIHTWLRIGPGSYY